MPGTRPLEQLPILPALDAEPDFPVGWQYKLNPTIAGEVCIDLDQTRHALGLAGLSTVTVSEFVGERTSTGAVVGGMDLDGAPILAGYTFAQANLCRIGYKSGDESKQHVVIQINRNEAGSKIANLTRVDVSLADAWIQVINQGVLVGLRFAAWARRADRSVPDRSSLMDVVKLRVHGRLLLRCGDEGLDLGLPDPSSYAGR